MATPQTPLAAGITNALAAANISRSEASRRLGVTSNTFNKRMASDGFTIRDLLIIAALTGVKLQTILDGVVSASGRAAA